MTGTAIYPVLGHPLYNQHLRVEVVGSRIELRGAGSSLEADRCRC